MSAPIARTALGDLQGFAHGGIATFRGVPFAAPPVGELRFAPPQPVRAWNGLRDATQHGPIAPQMPSRLSVAMGDYQRPQDEDCLTLTISTPAADGRSRPVLVWLHGGAWITGAGSLDWYDGVNLAREGDLVFVGVNHRLGALGWLHRSGLIDAEPGMADIAAALRWIREHIAGFGGDPRRVTVMGQSAGATNIGMLLLRPDTCSLFERAIMQSGGFGRGAYTSVMATQRADEYIRSLGIDPQAADTLARLREVPVARLLAAQGELAQRSARFGQTMPPFMPVVPQPMTQAEMLGAIADGATGKQVLIGATADEVHAFFAANPAMANPPGDAVLARFGSAAELARYRARRPGGTAMDLLADIASDETFAQPARHLAEAIARRGGTAYAYRFDWSPPGSRFLACHCIDLPFVFGTFDAWHAPMLAGGDAAQMAALSAAMRRAWIAFVHTGDPAHDELPEWPPHGIDHRQTMRFGRRNGAVGELGQ